MKSERRHDLETNELVVWIDKFRPYAGQTTAVVSVLVVLLAISSIWSSSSAAKREAAWDAFALASDISDPELMAILSAADNSEYAGTSMPEWALVTWADRQLLLATQAYLIDRAAAFSRVKKTVGIYSTLATAASDFEVQNRARFGLARAYELQNKLEEAKEQYELVQGDLSLLASQRADRLDLPEVQETCAWLATAELPRVAIGSEQQATGGQPDFNAEVPAVGTSESETETLEDLLRNLTKSISENTDDRYNEDTENTSESEGETSEEPAAESDESATAEEALESADDAAEGQ